MAKRKPSYIAFRQKLLAPVPLPFCPDAERDRAAAEVAAIITPLPVIYVIRRWHP